MNARFAPGDRVAVRRSESPGHIRTPHYVRGRVGVVERVCGPFANPEELAYGRDGLPAAAALPRPVPPGGPLARLQRAAGRQRRGRDLRTLAGAGLSREEHPMHDEHDHDHDARSSTTTHAHPKQPDVEDLPVTESQRLETAVRELLIEKGIFSGVRPPPDARDDRLLDARPRRPPGGAGLGRPGVQGPAAVRRPGGGAGAGHRPGPTHLVVLENTPERHNLVVCTLCSCYPKRILGIPPDWYKSRAYRSRAVHEPRAVLAEFGTELPEGVAVHVHDSTADLRYLVLPMRPAGNRGDVRGGAGGPGHPRQHDRRRVAPCPVVVTGPRRR